MTDVARGLDLVIAILLVGLAGRIMLTRDFFEATVLFIAFGLTLSLAWVRLEAPDVALAEAALGAGVTGALLLNALRRLTDEDGSGFDGTGIGSRGRRPPRGAGSPWVRRSMMAGLCVFAAGLAVILTTLPDRAATLPAAVAERLGETGASNAVTAVLLDFRSYDTLLEVGVLVVALVAVWSLDRGSRAFSRAPGEMAEDPVLEAWARLVVPVLAVAAVYLVWAGSSRPGGAFQAAALLAGGAVLILTAGITRPVPSAAPAVRLLGALGLVLFVVVGLGSMAWTGDFLRYPAGTAYTLVLLVESVLTVSIAVILVELVLDVPAVLRADPALEGVDPTGDPLGRTVEADGATVRGGPETE